MCTFTMSDVTINEAVDAILCSKLEGISSVDTRHCGSLSISNIAFSNNKYMILIFFRYVYKFVRLSKYSLKCKIKLIIREEFLF